MRTLALSPIHFWDRTPNTSFSKMVDQLFDEVTKGEGRLNGFNALADVVEHEDRFELNMSLPGMEKEHIQIDIEDQMLSISGERSFKREEKAKYHLVETGYGSFKRSFRIPGNVNPDQIKAEFKNGILTILMPKAEEKTLKKVEIA